MKKPIAISISPNTETDDVLLALRILFSPIRWFDIGETKKLESDFAGIFGKGYKALAVDSGRSAEQVIMNTLGVQSGDEIVLQALTCVVVVNPILSTGAKPVYVDVDETFNINPKDLSEKIGGKTKAIKTWYLRGCFVF